VSTIGSPHHNGCSNNRWRTYLRSKAARWKPSVRPGESHELETALAPVSKVKPIAFALAPVVGALLGWLVLHERMPATKWVALVLIVAGVVLLTREA